MSKNRMDWTEFEAALTDEERAAVDAIVAQLTDASLDQDAVRVAFFALAATVLARLGGGNPGPLWGALKKQHQPKQRDVQRVVRPLPKEPRQLVVAVERRPDEDVDRARLGRHADYLLRQLRDALA